MAQNGKRMGYKKRNNVKVATKGYVKKAIEAKRDVLTECYTNTQANVGYDAPYIADLSAVPNGNNGQDYDFHMCRIVSNFILGSASTNYVRWMVIQWFEDESVDAPTLAKVMCDSVSASSMYYQGFNEANNGQKFRVIKDKLIQLSTNKNDNVTAFTVNIKPKQLQRKVFRSTSGTGHKNNIYFIVFTATTAAAQALTVNQGITFQYKNRD